MTSKTRFPLSLTLSAVLVGVAIVRLASLAPAHAQAMTPPAQAPGGFVEPASSTATRPPLTAAQMQSLLPARGPFTFPAPYSTQGVRLTNATDCAGATDCVYSMGYAYWRNINNHAGSNTMLIAVTLLRSKGGAGPSLFSYNKVTGDTQNLGGLFDPASAFSWATGEGWYFSATLPTALYVNTPGGSTFYRYDVLSKTFQLIFDVAPSFGSDKYIWQLNSSNDDKVHSFTLRTHTNDAMLGCGAYNENTHQFSYFPAVGSFDECQIDKSGRYLLIKEHTGLGAGADDDNVIEDLQAGTEALFLDQAGAPGHSDNGFGYMVGEDNWAAQPGATRLWNLGLPFPAPIQGTAPGQGALVYQLQNWSTGLGHLTHANAKAGTPASQQYACVSNANRTNAPRVNELVCFMLDGSMRSLIVAPNMVDLNAPGGGSEDYWKLPKANLDVTGEYLIWTANQAGARGDAFLARVPAQLLSAGQTQDTTPPAVSLTAPAGGTTAAGNVIVSANATDNVGVTSLTFLLDGAPLGSALTAGPYSLAWASSLSANGSHVLTASARDAAGNTAVSSPVTVTVNNTLPTVTISGVTLSSITSSSATAGWTTSAPADSQVAYGLSASYGSATPSDTTMVTAHTRTLTGLAAGTTYHYQVLSRNSQGLLTASSDATFTTPGASLTRAPVQWTSAVNVAVTGSSLEKTSRCVGCPDAGAVSQQVIASGDGYVEFTASETSTLREIGLSNGNPGTTLTEIKFGLRLQSGGVEVRESGVSHGGTSFFTGDILRVALVGGRVQYSKNGSVFYTSTARPVYPLLVDTSLCDRKATIKNAVIASTAQVQPPTGTVPAVVWTSLVNVAVSGTTIQKTGGCGGCADAGAVSTQQIPGGDGYVEFTAADATALRAIGLSTGNPGTSLAEIAFAIRLQSGGAEIRENGVYRGDTPFTAGDVFRIAVVQGVVQYSKNGAVFYSSGLSPVYPLIVDTSFNDLGATITNAVIQGALSPVVWTNLVNANVGAGNVLQKAGGCDGCADAGATSQQQILSGDGYVEFTAASTLPLLELGLSNGNPGTSLTEITFGLRLQNGAAEVREGGTYRTDTPFVAGDVFRIAVAGGQIRYSKNGSVFYTSALTPAFPLVVDVALCNLGAQIAGAVMAGGR